MEEKEVKEQVSDRPEKMSYEQLENIAHQLSDQVKQLYSKLQATTVDNMFKRLDYLFRVVENRDAFTGTFAQRCATEIEELMTIPENTSEE